jgi:hypothetical protein
VPATARLVAALARRVPRAKTAKAAAEAQKLATQAPMTKMRRRDETEDQHMSQIKLWGIPKSINVQKVLWALDELGLKYERIDAGGPAGRNKDADYLSLNPNGLIPTLQDDGAAL